ncbi:MAG: hypothetical protein JNM30_19285 [Rhodospirillales bacterium]|nr:hypothetical protein [Rhodospirillales bacterium]
MPFDASTAVLDPDFPARSSSAAPPPVAQASRHPIAHACPAAMPFYSAAHPRPVSAIAPRLSRGVL